MRRMIFEPLTLGPVRLPNRIVRTAHGTHLGNDTISDDLIAYHEARARGGCGLSILEATSVHPSSSITLYNVDDGVVPGLRRLMDRVRPTGMRVFQQLYHGGHHYPARDGGPPWGASPIPSPVTGLVPIPMDGAQIHEVVAAFAAAAARCRAGGLDGVEIHGGHGYLIHQFLSPATNRRTDGYGGSLDGRMRLLREVLEAVRAAVGGKLAIGVRLSASEQAGGIGESELAEVIRRLEADGLIDYLNASWGDYFLMATMVGPMHLPSGYELPSSGQLTAASRKPRIVSGRFRTLEEAEQVLRSGVADLVSLVRAQIADPDLVAKTLGGRVDEIRPCIACNQGCVGGLVREHRIGCLVNPEAGREAALGKLRPVAGATAKRVLIVGAGPAGLEAARTAAQAGHHVILAEASSDLGGALDVARRAPHMHILADLIDWYQREIYRLGVEVRLSTFVTAADVRDVGPDLTIVATGAEPRMDGLQHADPAFAIEGLEQAHVLSPVELLTRPRLAGRRALVLDESGQFEALACAEQLLRHGFEILFVTGWAAVAPFAEPTMRVQPALQRLHGGASRFLVRHRLEAIGKGTCRVRPLAGGPAESVQADLVVLAGASTPRRELCDELKGEGSRVELIGDALAPRDALYAIREGRRAGSAVGED